MTLELEQLKRMHDKAYSHAQITREHGADDLVFYHITQWDDTLLSESQLRYRGEFNMLKKAGRSIISDLAENPVQVDFKPKDEDRDDEAETVDGMYRTDDAHNDSIEAYENAKQECVVCGAGAWKIRTKYVTLRNGDNRQVIRRQFIPEANNRVFWDPNDKSLDKSKARYVSVLFSYTKDGYKDLVKDLTGERPTDIDLSTFKNPEQSFVFPWAGGQSDKLYVTEFYYREKKQETRLTMVDPFGMSMELWQSDLKDVFDELMDAGFIIESEKTVDRYIVTKYIASGADILKTERIAGQCIPIVQMYGEHAVIEGEEHWEGITRLSKDPQRLRNFMLSYVADIVSRSPRRKPIFFPEQVAGYQHMYQDTGADNNYPYLFQNRKAPDGSDMPIGPVAEMPDQPIPTALTQMLQYTSDAIKDVVDPGIPQDIADPDVSGKAILALQARLDMQSTIYQQHFKHAKRRDGEIYVSMMAEVYDTPRKVTLTLPDGTRKMSEVMQSVIDRQTGETVFINDLTNIEFEVITRIGPDYGTQRQQTVDKLMEIIPTLDPGDPIRKALQLKVMQHTEGVDMDDIRKFARKQLILSGIQEPETDEERQMLEAMKQQGDEPSAEMVLALAEDKKGQAALLKEQREVAQMQIDTQNELSKRQIDAFKAQTDRMGTQIDAQEANATIKNKNIDTLGKKLDNTEKMMNIQQLSDQRLLELAGLGAA